MIGSGVHHIIVLSDNAYQVLRNVGVHEEQEFDMRIQVTDLRLGQSCIETSAVSI